MPSALCVEFIYLSSILCPRSQKKSSFEFHTAQSVDNNSRVLQSKKGKIERGKLWEVVVSEGERRIMWAKCDSNDLEIFDYVFQQFLLFHFFFLFRILMSVRSVFAYKWGWCGAVPSREEGKVKKDKFSVNFKRLLINGEQYITNVEKFENQEWKFEGGNGSKKEKREKTFLSRLTAKRKSIIYQKSIQLFTCVCCTL